MKSAADVVIGGFYASRGTDGSYRVAKVLAVDAFAVHLRKYAERFDELPEGVDSSRLSPGRSGRPEASGIGHFPLTHEGFWRAEPVLVGREPVDPDELKGYHVWAGIDPVD